MRENGILLHITSLPQKGGIGTLGKSAYDFIDFLQSAGVQIWQVLPVGPTGFGDSPYQSASTFAGNPLLIDIEMLEEEGILPRGSFVPLPDSDKTDFDSVRLQKEALLRKAYYYSFSQNKTDEFEASHPWVRDYALFMALKKSFHDEPWQNWPDEYRTRSKGALENAAAELKDEVFYHIFVQRLFYNQWKKLRAYANHAGVKLFGDMPIYVAADSADAWSHPELFQMRDCRPIKVAGVPPDYFSEDGQLWGNPLYNWDAMKKDKFSWWIKRLNAMQEMFDLLRIDHFIGFANYYSINADAKNARAGEWVKAPGRALFRRVKREIKGMTVIAEDLGQVSGRVRRLLRYCGFPGMKVLQFAYGGDKHNPHLPSFHKPNCIVYTGTHDNDTALGWWNAADEKTKAFAARQLQLQPGDDIAGKLIETAFASRANCAIILMQDYLRLPADARMNTPGTVGGNWAWRMTRMPGQELKDEIKALAEKYARK